MRIRLPSLLLVLPALALSACPSNPPTEDASTDAHASDASDGGMDAAMDAPDAAPDAAPDVAPDALRPPPITRTMSETALEPQRQGCMFQAGAWPAETLGTEIPLGDDIPIQHVLILMQENRSFDEYFSTMTPPPGDTIEQPPANWSNPNGAGGTVERFHDTTFCVNDVDHSWNASHTQYNNGANDGFVTTNNPMGERAMAYETAEDIPFYHSLASTFAMGDHYHCSLLGPTWPNRYFLMAATSFGYAENVPDAYDTAAHPSNTIFRRLDDAQYDWKDYCDNLRMTSFFPYYSLLRRATRDHLVDVAHLMSDLQNDTLPPFAFIEPVYTGTGGDRNDEHPPGMPQRGEQWVEGIVRALMASPAWRNTVLFITYDEHGGFADHVPPPAACPPDNMAPNDGNGRMYQGAFDRLGFRVPFIVVSPYARANYVSHHVYDHTSLLRFVEAKFGLPAMTARDANATPPMDMFDFAHPPFMTPPTTLAPSQGNSPSLQPARDRCNAAFPSTGGL